MTEDRDEWRKYVHGVANRRIEDGLENRTEQPVGQVTAGFIGRRHRGNILTSGQKIRQPPQPAQY